MNKSLTSYAKLELSKDANPESLQRWVVAFCIIKFDLEQGQLIEECYPPGVLSNEEELDVSFSSFPDSVSQNQNHNHSSIHDCMFFFRTRRRKRFQQRNVPSSEVTEVNDKPALSDSTEAVVSKTKVISNQKNFKYLYGYVFNRQRHDERLKRGGEQKSVVILSHNPYSNVFRPLLQVMAPLYFDIGKKALEHIAAYISLWPAPLPGKFLMELPIGNAKLKVYLPPPNSLSAEHLMIEDSTSFMAPIPSNNQSIPQGIFHDADIFGIFRGILSQLWLLWELLLIGEPILIIGPTPPQCSEAVASLISLVAPLPCSVDFRPYFTIHDPEFAQLTLLREGETFPAMVLGVTNLFFLKALRNIPHVVSVGSPAPNSISSLVNRSSSSQSPGRSEGLGLQQLSLKRFSPLNLLSAVKLKRDGPLCLMTEHKEAVWSTYVPTTKPDTSILNRLIDVGTSLRAEDSMAVVNNGILRRHFLELTTNFLSPFGPYFRATAPSEGSSSFVDPPSLPPFIAEDFLESLSSRGIGKFLSKRMRPNWLDLYNRFLKGPNFMPWFQSRRIVAEQEQRRLWRQASLKADLHKVLPNMSQVEVVETFNVIERHLNEEIQLQRSGRAFADSAAICQKLKKDLQAVFNVLPKDIQKLVLMNPDKAALLRRNPEPVKLPGRPSLQIGVVSSSSTR